MSYLQKYVFQKQTKYVNIKVFNMITTRNKAKIIENHVLCDCKCKLSSIQFNSNQEWNSKICLCE